MIEAASLIPGSGRFAPFLPSLCFGIASIAVFWWLGRSWFGTVRRGRGRNRGRHERLPHPVLANGSDRRSGVVLDRTFCWPWSSGDRSTIRQVGCRSRNRLRHRMVDQIHRMAASGHRIQRLRPLVDSQRPQATGRTARKEPVHSWRDDPCCVRHFLAVVDSSRVGWWILQDYGSPSVVRCRGGFTRRDVAKEHD